MATSIGGDWNDSWCRFGKVGRDLWVAEQGRRSRRSGENCRRVAPRSCRSKRLLHQREDRSKSGWAGCIFGSRGDGCSAGKFGSGKVDAGESASAIGGAEHEDGAGTRQSGAAYDNRERTVFPCFGGDGYRHSGAAGVATLGG